MNAEMPKKKNQQPNGTYLDYGNADIFNNGYNQCYDEWLAYHTKKMTEFELFKAKYFSNVEGVRYSQIIELEQENTRLKGRLRKAEKMNDEPNAYNDNGNPIKYRLK